MLANHIFQKVSLSDPCRSRLSAYVLVIAVDEVPEKSR
jgi:hypothetical protein